MFIKAMFRHESSAMLTLETSSGDLLVLANDHPGVDAAAHESDGAGDVRGVHGLGWTAIGGVDVAHRVAGDDAFGEETDGDA